MTDIVAGKGGGAPIPSLHHFSGERLALSGSLEAIWESSRKQEHEDVVA